MSPAGPSVGVGAGKGPGDRTLEAPQRAEPFLELAYLGGGRRRRSEFHTWAILAGHYTALVDKPVVSSADQNSGMLYIRTAFGNSVAK